MNKTKIEYNSNGLNVNICLYKCFNDNKITIKYDHVHHIRQRYLQHIKSVSIRSSRITLQFDVTLYIFAAAANHDDGGGVECLIQ